MTHGRGALAWLSALLALTAGASSALGFGFEPDRTRWPRGRPIEFVVNLAHVPPGFPRDQYLAYLRKALAPWEAIDTAELPFTIGTVITDGEETQPQADGINMIFWQPGFVPRDQFAGKAYPFPTECDILLAPRAPFTLLDIQAIIMHELGHCMGLAHSTALGVMTPFTGLPTLGYDDRIAVSLLYPNRRHPLGDGTAVLAGRVVRRNGDPVVGAVLRLLEARTQRILLSGYSGLVGAQQRPDGSGAFELPGVPPGTHRLRIEPMDAFSAADPRGYGAPSAPPAPFKARILELPSLDAGDTRDLGALTVEE